MRESLPTSAATSIVRKLGWVNFIPLLILAVVGTACQEKPSSKGDSMTPKVEVNSKNAASKNGIDKATAPQAIPPATRGYSLPVVDINSQTDWQVVIDKERGQYLGHPTTVMLDDNKTIIIVYPKGHGRGAIVMKRSTDTGLSWGERITTPTNWASSQEVPTLYKMTDPRNGKKRIVMFSGITPIRMSYTEDEGKTWTPLAPIGDYGGIVAMSDCIQLKNGNYLAFFHQPLEGVLKVLTTESSDGGLTWGDPRIIAEYEGAHLCEAGVLRSPDGNQIALLLRENSRRFNSFVTFSDDEGATWSKPRELPAALTGDRHQAIYAPDGRLFISFRDISQSYGELKTEILVSDANKEMGFNSPTSGDWVGWVGSYDDIVHGREGQYRVRLKDNNHSWDCAYPALELLPDGSIFAATYGYWDKGEPPYILGMRFKLEQLDALPKIYPRPLIPTFKILRSEKSIHASLSCCPNAVIRYTTDGKIPDEKSRAYKKPILLERDTVIKARTYLENREPSEVAELNALSFVPPPTPPMPEVHLSEITPVSVKVGWGNFGINKSCEGNPLIVAGKTYAKGIGVHSVSELVYDCRPSYARFVAIVGLDDEIKAHGGAKISFEVYADSKKLTETPSISWAGTNIWHIDVEIPKGISRLKLVTTDGGNGIGGDHADWVNAGFILNEVDNSETVIVKNGEIVDANIAGKPWVAAGNKLTCEGTGNFLWSNKLLAGNDAHIKAKLSIKNLKNSASAFTLSGSNFGFAGRDGVPFTEGPLFGNRLSLLNNAAGLIKDGKPFLFEVVVKNGTAHFLIDGTEVHSVSLGKNIPLGFALRPWRSTMSVEEFTASGDLTDPATNEQALFTSGNGGYKSYRIPAIVNTTKGTLLAFCEGRKNGSGDSGDIDIVLRRSTDNGITWSETLVVWDDAGNTCGNPAPVVDKTTGTVWLLSVWNSGHDHESKIIAGTSKDTRRVYVCSSTDDGLTWSEPVEITKDVKLPSWTWYATGPGNGIQLSRGKYSGRLVIPCNHAEAETRNSYSHVIYSDDHGKTWQLGGSSPKPKTNESTIVELTDGQLMLNMRNYDRSKPARAVCLSSDGGATFANQYLDETLIEPICQANILRYSWPEDGLSRVLFSNPANTGGRSLMTVKVSYDEGKTWPSARLINAGSSAYSCLVKAADGSVGCLYEKDGYRSIVYAKMSIKWLDAE